MMDELKYEPVPHRHAEFLARAERRAGFSEAYDSLEPEYALASQMLNAGTHRPLRHHRQAWIVVIAVVVLCAIYFCISWMYQARVLLTGSELAWKLSQQAAAPSGAQLAGNDTAVTLTRTTCEGTCPDYVMTVYGSGRVEFRGRAFVCDKSPPAAQVDPAAVRRLVDGLVAAGFSKMPSYTKQEWSDNPSATVTLKQGSTVHTVEHYHGDRSAPRLLSMMEERIDEVAGSAAWLATWDGRQYVCTGPGGEPVPIQF